MSRRGFAGARCAALALSSAAKSFRPDAKSSAQAGPLHHRSGRRARCRDRLGSINAQLEQFEKDTSNQIVVAIYPSLPPDAEIAQYATDTYNAWGIGQKGKDNGAILFVFVNDHKMFIATGRGLEGALPDAICKNIITQVIAPQFKQGDYAGGIQAGVNAMIAATKGEYKGNGSTVADARQPSHWAIPISIIVWIILFSLSSLSVIGGWRLHLPRLAGPGSFTPAADGAAAVMAEVADSAAAAGLQRGRRQFRRRRRGRRLVTAF